jgi:hypothetical protein
MRYDITTLRWDQLRYLCTAIEQGSVVATLIVESKMAKIEVNLATIDQYNLRRYVTNAKRGLISCMLVIEQSEDVLAPIAPENQVKRVVGKRKAATPAAAPEAGPADPAASAPRKRS